MPFSKDLAPSMLAATSAHHEAVARIGWCVTEEALGVITGEVGAGKTVAARAALAGLDGSRHTIIYHGKPAVGPRALYAAIITTLRRTPPFHKAALLLQSPDELAVQALVAAYATQRNIVDEASARAAVTEVTAE